MRRLGLHEASDASAQASLPGAAAEWEPLVQRQRAIATRWMAIVLATIATLSSVPAGAEPELPWNPAPPTRFRELWPVDSAGEAALVADLEGAYQFHHTTHFSIGHSTATPAPRYRGEILESIFAAFTLFFESHGFELEPSDFLLPVILFPTREDFVRRLGRPDLPENVQGLYLQEANVALFFDHLGRSETRRQLAHAQRRETDLRRLRREVQSFDEGAMVEIRPATGAARRMSKHSALRMIDQEIRTLTRTRNRYREEMGQGSIETMCHEGAHQLSFSMGVFPRDRRTPAWIAEGLATFFEPSRHGYLLETGSIHWRRLAALNRAYAQGEGISLRRLIENDELFHDEEAAVLAYDEAWSVVHFLATKRPDRLMAYLRMLRELDADTAEGDGVAIFEKALESPVAEIDQLRRAHVESLGAPVADTD